MFSWFKKIEKQKISVPENIKAHSSWIRLENQIDWYDKKSSRSQKWYKGLKLLQIILAVGIPLLTHSDQPSMKWIISGVGASIAILESIQHMNQYSSLWIIYRSTAERLKHEKFLFLANAGPYRYLNEVDCITVLAERVEELVCSEHTKWFNETKKTTIKQSENVKNETPTTRSIN